MEAFIVIALFVLFFLFRELIKAWGDEAETKKTTSRQLPPDNRPKESVRPVPPSSDTANERGLRGVKPLEERFKNTKLDKDIPDISFYDYDESLSSYNPQPFRAAPKKELTDIKFLHTGEKAGFNYHALTTYFPKNKYKSAPAEVTKNRELIYGFKEGMNWMAVADRLHDALINQYPEKHKKWKPSNVMLSVIPSSTKSKTGLRFSHLCDDLSQRLGIANGYRAISVTSDRKPMKGMTRIDKTSNLRYDAALIKGKYVLLLDDIITSGESFEQNANMLKKLGAELVIGLFVGKTYDSYRNGEPDWATKKKEPVSIFDDGLDDLPF